VADLDTIARRAGEAARAEARARGRRMTPPGQQVTAPSPWRHPALVGLVVLVGVLLAVAGGRLLVETGLVIDPVGPAEEPGTLPVPEVGSVAPGYLEDGTPVFVSHPEDGTLLVFDATSPHQGNKLVAYCGTSELFEDLYHGSRFTGWGDWIAGPSPTGLRVVPHELLADGQRLRVTGPAGAGTERTQPRGPDDIGPQGPSCEPGYNDLSSAVRHRPPVEPRALDGGDIPSERWVWASLMTGGSVDDPRVCDTDGSCPADAPSALPNPVTTEIADTFLQPTRGVWLARATGDGAVQLRRPALPLDGPVEAWPQGALPVPAPGEVLAAYGWNRSPLFVVTDEDGSTLVLDATSPRHPTDLLGWCPDEGRFVDGSGARYDRSGQAIDAGAPMRRYEHAVSDAGRGELQAGRLLFNAGEWQTPRFVPEAVPGSGPQAAPCVGALVHGPADGGAEEERGDLVVDVDGGDPGGSFQIGTSWLWVEAAVREVDGAFRLCLGSLACDGPDDPIVTTPGTAAIAWPEQPQLLYVQKSDDGAEVDVGGEGDGEPYRVQLRRPVLPNGR
jgi:hypothetical protein